MSHDPTTPGIDAPADDATTGDATTGDALADADRTGVDAAGPLDLERIARDLAGVEAALRRLDDGTYWNDEVTGEPIPDDVLAADPVARRVG